MTALGSSGQTWATPAAAVALQAVAWLTVGTLLGSFHFLTLRWNVRLAVRRSPLVAAALQFARFALLAVVLAAVAGRCGALPLLLAAAGIWIARTAVTRLGASP